MMGFAIPDEFKPTRIEQLQQENADLRAKLKLAEDALEPFYAKTLKEAVKPYAPSKVLGWIIQRAANTYKELVGISDDDRLVTVCDKCLQASCWQGIFYCNDYKEAGTVDLPISELKALNREHPDYWKEGSSTAAIRGEK